MSETDETRSTHERVAATSNNRAWALSVRLRTAAEDREMLDAAHASAWHWGQGGTELHRMRATMLVAEVHALLGYGTSAWQFASEMHAYFLARPETPDSERAFAHAILAHAAAVDGRGDEHRAAYADATAALAAIADPEDRAIVYDTFRHVPVPSADGDAG